MNAALGDQVAPGGVGLDPISVDGTHHAAIRALGKKVSAIEQELGLRSVAEDKAKGKGKALPKMLQGDLTPQLLGLETV